ncbi:MAG TPA: valine--tRNA ligase [Pyrinomonadaceae bacterium]
MTEKKPVLTIDPSTLPSHFEAKNVEERWTRQWAEWQLHDYADDKPREETFVIDTPPPTVSGELHMGHIFSYTQTDVIARHQRMRGRDVFYPMGWDDNGLPTERRVQNYFHVRCDPTLPYDPGLSIETISDKEKKERPPRVVSRDNFIELCLRLTREDEETFKALWNRIGLSVDWKQEYSTIDNLCRRLAQFSFIDLYRKGHVYQVESPTIWDVEFQTAIAQAEVEDRPVPGALHHIRFGVEGSDETFTIATTRPELLPACVAVTAHPDDERYQGLFGKRAVSPLFHIPVLIFPSKLVSREKGTGILMICTFGDATDVIWWREQGLPLRQILGLDGRLMPVTFGTDGWESLNPEAANNLYRELSGKNLNAARKAIVAMLRVPPGEGQEPPLVEEPKPLEHAVKFFEKGSRPLEIIPTKQWFVRLLDKIDSLLEAGDRITWHPDFMRLRYRDWTKNLQIDWCISRQRFFGVPFPVWFPVNAEGEPDRTNPIIASPDHLPVDPMTTPPPGFDESQRNQPNGFAAETDVFDTWFTSSLTPQICTQWQLGAGRHQKLFPTDLRPQSHEIIRTWAFYTIVKALLHEDAIPWKHAAISGWILDPDRKKMSKTKDNATTPMPLLEKYGADAVRYWTASARLGVDTAFDQNVFKVGKRLVTKIFNAGKFVLSQTAEQHPITNELDLIFMRMLRELVRRVGESYDRFDYAAALKETESFFWNSFTDAYMEMVKSRARGKDTDEAGRGSAVASLRRALSIFLRLFAPVLPYVTEDVWSWAFAQETGNKSIHRADWPTEAEFADLAEPPNPASFDVAVAFLNTINKGKATAKMATGHPLDLLVVAANNATADKLKGIITDVMSGVRARSYRIEENDGLGDEEFEIIEARFAQDS